MFCSVKIVQNIFVKILPECKDEGIVYLKWLPQVNETNVVLQDVGTF